MSLDAPCLDLSLRQYRTAAGKPKRSHQRTITPQGDPIPRITRGIGNIVVCSNMNNDRASISVKDRRLSRTERNTIYEHLITAHSVFLHIHVRQITCVWTGRVL